MVISLAELAAAVGGALPAGRPRGLGVSNFAYRLAEVSFGSLYVAAARIGDGPDRGRAAVERGATAVLAEGVVSSLPAATSLLRVADAEAALYRWAHQVRRAWRPRAVHLIGEAPQPALGELTERVLASRFRVTRARPRPVSAGRLDFPAQLAEMEREAEVAIFHLRRGAAGRISAPVSLLPPEVAVIGPRFDPTAFGAELDAIVGAAAKVVGDGDDERWRGVRERSRARITFGRADADLVYDGQSSSTGGTQPRFSNSDTTVTAARGLVTDGFLATAVAGSPLDCASAAGCANRRLPWPARRRRQRSGRRSATARGPRW